MKRTLSLLLILFVLAAFPSRGAWAQDNQPVPIGELEKELSDIEGELTDLEKRIDILLQDLVDPKISSLSVFFISQNIRGYVPASLEISLDDELLASKKFDQTDRLVLVRGGAIEIHKGIADPDVHTLTVECFLTSSTQEGNLVSTGKTRFRFESMRAMDNFLEITLAVDPTKKVNPFKLVARQWSREH